MTSSAKLTKRTSHRGRPREFRRETALLNALDVFWKCGYEPASISQLCSAMEINPPSLYAAFGNKAQLFLEAVNHYEHTFWDSAWSRLDEGHDVKDAVIRFYKSAAEILTSTDAPCGCMVILAAINVSIESQTVIDALKKLRHNSQNRFKKRLSRAIKEGQLPVETNISALSATLYALIEGMSIQARDGASQSELEYISEYISLLFPRTP